MADCGEINDNFWIEFKGLIGLNKFGEITVVNGKLYNNWEYSCDEGIILEIGTKLEIKLEVDSKGTDKLVCGCV